MEESLVTNFILSNHDLVEEELLSEVEKGSDVAITKALNLIHLRSLPSRGKKYKDNNGEDKALLKMLTGSNDSNQYQGKGDMEHKEGDSWFEIRNRKIVASNAKHDKDRLEAAQASYSVGRVELNYKK